MITLQAQCRVNPPGVSPELKLLCYLFITDFIVINDSVPNEDKVLCLVLALPSFICRPVWEGADLQENELRLSRLERDAWGVLIVQGKFDCRVGTEGREDGRH